LLYENKFTHSIPFSSVIRTYSLILGIFFHAFNHLRSLFGVDISKSGTAKDYEDLIADVIAKVKENSGVTLEPEVRIIGDELN